MITTCASRTITTCADPHNHHLAEVGPAPPCLLCGDDGCCAAPCLPRGVAKRNKGGGREGTCAGIEGGTAGGEGWRNEVARRAAARPLSPPPVAAALGLRALRLVRFQITVLTALTGTLALRGFSLVFYKLKGPALNLIPNITGHCQRHTQNGSGASGRTPHAILSVALALESRASRRTPQVWLCRFNAYTTSMAVTVLRLAQSVFGMASDIAFKGLERRTHILAYMTQNPLYAAATSKMSDDRLGDAHLSILGFWSWSALRLCVCAQWPRASRQNPAFGFFSCGEKLAGFEHEEQTSKPTKLHPSPEQSRSSAKAAK